MSEETLDTEMLDAADDLAPVKPMMKPVRVWKVGDYYYVHRNERGPNHLTSYNENGALVNDTESCGNTVAQFNVVHSSQELTGSARDMALEFLKKPVPVRKHFRDLMQVLLDAQEELREAETAASQARGAERAATDALIKRINEDKIGPGVFTVKGRYSFDSYAILITIHDGEWSFTKIDPVELD